VRLSVTENVLTSVRLQPSDYVVAIEQTGRGWVIECRHPAHEGRGHGRLLHDTTIEWLFAGGHDRLSLTTGPGTRAEGFYLAAGWQPAGHTDGGELMMVRGR